MASRRHRSPAPWASASNSPGRGRAPARLARAAGTLVVGMPGRHIDAGRREELPGDVVTVLLRPEDTPALREGSRHGGPQQAADRRVAVRDVNAGDLVVAVVVEAGGLVVTES